MRGRWSRSGCLAPVHARGGWLRCVVQAERCDYPGHQTWNRWGWPLVQIVWWLKPWWPNAIGRAQDRAGRAHWRERGEAEFLVLIGSVGLFVVFLAFVAIEATHG